MLIGEEEEEMNEKKKMFRKYLIYIKHYAQHLSDVIFLDCTLLGEIFIQKVQPNSEGEWRNKGKALICLLISLRVIKRPSNLMVYSCWSYTENGPSSSIIALISLDMYHQEE